MASRVLKWLIPGAVTVLGGTGLAVALSAAPLTNDLQLRTTEVIRSDALSWANVRIEGRDAILGGTATTQAAIDEAMVRLESVPGVRSVSSDVVLAEFVSPFPFSAILEDGRVTLSGGYPSEAVHAALQAELGASQTPMSDSTRLLSGAPDTKLFEAGAKFALSSLPLFDRAEATLEDLSLSISGRAKSTEAFGVLQTLEESVPTGVQLAALTITPPLASPYKFTVTFDGERVALTGNIPDAVIEARLREAAPVNLQVSTSLSLSSGEPEGFAENALNLLKAVLLLEQGQGSIVDGDVTLEGAPATPAIVAEVTAAIARLGGTSTLEPPRIADFRLAVDKSSDALVFSGFVPNMQTRDKLRGLAGADITALELARGAPDRYESGLDFGLDLLGYLGTGRLEINATSISLAGRPASLTDYRALMAKLQEGAPQGFAIASADIQPPIASPYVFKAAKDEAGETRFSGFLPSEASRSELKTRVEALVSDETDPAGGEPDNFTFLAGKGLDVLALLDSGSVSFDGKNWSIEGLVDTPQKGFAADAAYSENALRSFGVAYNVRQPVLPVISPYVWRAQKAADGSLAITGFAPHDTFRQELRALAPEMQDGSALGAGAPADFEASARAGLQALLAIDEGSLVLSGTMWTLTGQVGDSKTREAVQAALSAAIDTASWRVAVQANDSAPVVTPYVWSASKASGSGVELSGYVPSEEVKAEAAVRAGTVSQDLSTIASGEPSGFTVDMLVGLDALSHLTEGRVAFDGSRWVLTGTVASQAAGDQAVAALRAGSREGASWTSYLSGYSPAVEPSVELPSAETSSEVVASSELLVSSEPPSISETASSEPTETPSVVSLEPLSSDPPLDAPSEPLSLVEQLPSEEPAADPAEDRSLTVVDPMPDRFTFEASKDTGQPIALRGVALHAATIRYFGELAGSVDTGNLVVSEGLPTDFAVSGAAGLRALLQVNEGRLGFDGTRWWFRGMVENAEARDAISSSLAALRGGEEWSVLVGVLAPIDICRERVTALERLNAITFQSGSATLTETSLPILDELAVDLNICPEASVHVEGHTDSDGAEDLNLALSVSRAESVVEALIARGVALERLYAEGFGESQPIAENDTREGKARNRRIVFSISME